MASSLQQQLQAVSAALGKGHGEIRRSHASLLYSEREAGDIDTHTIHSNALHGTANTYFNNPYC